MTAFYLMILLCDLDAGKCKYIDLPIAPFASFEDCADEGILQVLDNKTFNGYRCVERKLER